MLIGDIFRDVYSMGLKGPIFGQFGLQSKSKFWTFLTFAKVFIGFTLVLLDMLIARTFSGVSNMELRRLIL